MSIMPAIVNKSMKFIKCTKKCLDLCEIDNQMKMMAQRATMKKLKFLLKLKENNPPRNNNLLIEKTSQRMKILTLKARLIEMHLPHQYSRMMARVKSRLPIINGYKNNSTSQI